MTPQERIARLRADERFWAKVDQAGECWIWTAYKNAGGYGMFGYGGKAVRAARWIYEREVGLIPEGLVIDHLCRNRACVRVTHLEVVANRTNILRGVGPSAVNASLTNCPAGHEFTPENTSIGTKGERRCRACYAEWKRRRYAANAEKNREAARLRYDPARRRERHADEYTTEARSQRYREGGG